jgi:hypothetical protein
MAYQTTELLDDLYRLTESFLETAVREWQLLPEEHLAHRPAPGSWSAAQCIEHLNFYGRYYLPAIEKAIAHAKKAGSKPATTFHPGILGGYFTRLMQPQPNGSLKSKMKSPQNAVPQSSPDPAAVIAEFIDQQETTLRLLQEAKEVHLERVKIPISIARWIRIRLGDTFMFFTAHHQRHILQAERALATVRKEETTHRHIGTN